jgi:DNA-binding LacI/PurR family transcriptional regulator
MLAGTGTRTTFRPAPPTALVIGSPPVSARTTATLKHVAQRAGVSTATVARVLHGKGSVAPATRRVVEAAIAESGYRLNVVAQGLRKRRTLVLGHVLQTMSLNPFFAGVAVGAGQEAARHGCGMLVYDTQGDAAQERIGVEMLIGRRVDAILFTTPTDQKNVELAVEAGIEVVQVERVGRTPTHVVTVDNHVGAYAATEHLIALGHRRIAFLGVDPQAPKKWVADTDLAQVRAVERERLGGYLAAMKRHGIPIPPALISLGTTAYSIERGQESARHWLGLPAAERPTAIFATCDILAAGVLQALYELGLNVPRDVSVVGFDDTYAPYLTPPLTTVEQPVIALGEAAARLAIQALQAGDDGHQRRAERLATRLVLRASTGAASY